MSAARSINRPRSTAQWSGRACDDRVAQARRHSGGRRRGLLPFAGADEERTLARLRALRSDLIDPTIAIHRGRVVKRTGDGALVEFRSVVDAVRCAVEIQNAMIERNAGVEADRRIEFRIGVHLGDVVEEADGDLMVTASISQRASKASRSPERLPCPRTLIARCGRGSIFKSAILAKGGSRTLPNRSGSIRWRSAGSRRRPARPPRWKERRPPRRRGVDRGPAVPEHERRSSR